MTAGMHTPQELEALQRNGIVQTHCSIPGKHSYDVRGVVFTLDKRYKIGKVIGVGAYGVVVAAIDLRTGAQIALKKISSVFDDLIDAKRVLREIRLMRCLNHENILPLNDMEAPESLECFDELYMASPLYDKDLSKVLASNVKLSDEHHQYFVYQILCALNYLHSACVLHRDLKPANILLQESCDLSICDFGLARYAEGEQRGMTEYVVTRWYRAPELVLTQDYTSAVDLWALGCIMGDLLGRKVLFPGKDFKHQVETICQILGKPCESDIQHVTSRRARKFLAELPDSTPVPFTQLFPDANPLALDLMKGLLRFDPSERLTAAQALQHPYVSGFHDEEFERNAGAKVDLSSIEPRRADGGDLSAQDLKRMMLGEIYHFRPDAKVFTQHPDLIPRDG